MRFQNGTGTLEVLQKTKIEFPRWARSVVFLCSHPAWERDFCFLQHLCSESAWFSLAKMGDKPRDLCSRFKFIYEKRFRPPGARFGPQGPGKRKKPKKFQSDAKFRLQKSPPIYAAVRHARSAHPKPRSACFTPGAHLGVIQI